MQNTNQQTIVIGLVVVAALLAGIVGVLIWQQSTAIPSPTVQTGAPTGQQMPPQGSSGAMGQQLGTNPGGEQAAPFDAKTATKIPKGTEPDAYVKAYYEACQKGEFDKAFKMLPAENQAAQTAEDFAAQMKGYGIAGYEIASSKGDDKEVKVVGVMKAQGMDFPYTWTIVKGDDGTWLVKSRKMGAN